MRRYNWHNAGSLGWPFPMLKYKHIFRRKYTEAILSNSSRKLLWFEITKMLITLYKNNFIVSFVIIFGTLSFRISQTGDIAIRVHQRLSLIVCKYLTVTILRVYY